ncbi:hypothetical protein XELAEV_18007885mg [Xenopus laevis]|uniref:Uncharacterized protein n=1 Tax=Xenopus laevis TaxID=8355 RepID=A0A974I4W6_XENLA|nr:hypothetical protein XELAEV_18007885mg [Xenopus laevis]
MILPLRIMNDILAKRMSISFSSFMQFCIDIQIQLFVLHSGSAKGPASLIEQNTAGALRAIKYGTLHLVLSAKSCDKPSYP